MSTVDIIVGGAYEDAYGHSFSPATSLGYVGSMVAGGWRLHDALNQAAIEHGQDQAVEAARLIGLEMEGRPNRRQSIVAACRRARRHAETIAAQIRRDRIERDCCAKCGAALSNDDIDDNRVLCDECRPRTYECDNGHRWRATKAADEANAHRCPTCGHYWQ